MNILLTLVTTAAVYFGLPVLAVSDPATRKPAPSGAGPAGSDDELVALCEAFLAADNALIDAARAHFARVAEGREDPAIGKRYAEASGRYGDLEARLLDARPSTLAGAVALARVVTSLSEEGGDDAAVDRLALNLAQSVARLGNNAR